MLDILRDAAWEGIAAIIGIISLIVGIVLYFFPRLRKSFREFIVLRWQKIFLVFLFVIFFILGVYAERSKIFQRDANEMTVNVSNLPDTFPLNLSALYDFENAIAPTNIRPWLAHFETRSDNETLLINFDPNNAFSGSKSLQVNTELLKLSDNDWTSIKRSNLPEERILLATAWVYIPANESTMNSTVLGRLELQSHGINVFGKELNLEPGKWTQLVVGGASSVEEISLDNEYFRIDTPEQTDILEIKIWDHEHSFVGSIYIDDINLYVSP